VAQGSLGLTMTLGSSVREARERTGDSRREIDLLQAAFFGSGHAHRILYLRDRAQRGPADRLGIDDQGAGGVCLEAAALRLLERQERPITLLLTDVIIREMSGNELAEQVAHPSRSQGPYN
jgi:hypothetical protein